MRVKMKISFQAFMKNDTVLEHWLKTIERSIKYLIGSGQLPKDKFSLKKQLVSKLDANFLLNIENIAKL